MCGQHQSCQSGTCACALGFADCGAGCVEVASDPKNCGDCGNVCGAGLVCSQGACAAGCAGGLTACNGACADLTGSPVHCGACNNACPDDQDCWQSQCRCPTGKASCNGGACQDVTSDEQNCGECGRVCPAGSTCTAGECVCPEVQTACGNTCADLTLDEQHCGTCGKVCSGSTQCLSGGCVDPTSVNCGSASQAGKTCTKDAFIETSKYWINNNQWGSDTGSGSQCIWKTCASGDLVGWGTSWQWTGQSNSVKTYAALVFGWQWGWKIQNTGLPVQISSNKNVSCGWSFNVTMQNTNTLNVAYDMWVHAISNPDYANDPTDEIMVWLYRSNGAGPIGTKTTTVSLAGSNWDLYEGNGGASWKVFSFVRTSNATTAVMNMMDFPRYLVAQSKMSGSKYLSSVQAGTEVFIGQGQLDTNGFYCRVQ